MMVCIMYMYVRIRYIVVWYHVRKLGMNKLKAELYLIDKSHTAGNCILMYKEYTCIHVMCELQVLAVFPAPFCPVMRVSGVPN